MDETIKHHNPNPISSANVVSKVFFWWLNPLMKTGYKRQLEIEDMYNVAQEDSSNHLGTTLEIEWEKEVKRKKDSGGHPSLMWALVRCFGLKYMFLGIIAFIEEGTKVIQPLMLGGMIRYFVPNSTVSMYEAYLYATGVSLCAVVLGVFHHPYFFSVTRIGMQLRIACCSLMYKKSLRLSNKALGETTVGQIVNLMSNDVNRFDQGVMFLHFLWIGPLQAIAVLTILWYELGPAVLAGFAVLLLLIPMQAWMGKLFSTLRQKTAKHTDNRIRVMNEIISGMRVIKMYCWEKPFGDLVEKIRRPETRWQLWRNNSNGFLSTLRFSSVAHSLLAIVAVLVLSGRGVSARVAFLSRLYLGVAGSLLVGAASMAVQMVAELRVNIMRIQTFLSLEELDESSIIQKSKEHNRPPLDECYVKIDDVTAKWDQKIEQNTLEKISACVKAGELLAVIGPVGAGKSSLLMSILGELPTSEGSIEVKGKVAYISQEPWVFSATLRQNITMGSKFDSALYEKSIRACALKRDLQIMPNGDSTLIGDRGVSLSGGQRARVSLARALYTDADIYLLDDPLSCVDTAIGRHIFNECIQGVLRKKPRILVTHQVQYLQDADQILILKEGKILGTGTFEELSKSGIDFASLLKHDDSDDEDNDKKMDGVLDLHDSIDNIAASLDHLGSVSSLDRLGSAISIASITSEFVPKEVPKQDSEQRREGTVGMSVYVKYFRAGSGILVFTLLVILNILAQTSYVMSDLWLSRWANQEEDRFAAVTVNNHLLSQGINVTNVTIPVVDTTFNIAIFTAIVGGVLLFGLLRALLFFKIAVDASATLHNRMFARILRCPISFFDNNPVGRILNRFSKDVGHIDDLLPITFFDFIQCFLLIISIVIVSGVINPVVFIPVIPICVLFVIIRLYYLRTSRSIKRLEGTTRSPVFSHLSASLQGLHTIRALNMETQFLSEFDSHQDLHTEAFFLFLSTSRWLAIRLDWLCVLFVTTVCYSSIILANTLDAGQVGLTVTYAMTLMGMFQWGVRQSAEVENQMISVERVIEYSQLPEEAALDSDPGKKPPPSWPQHGIISGEGASLKYSQDGPNIIKEITFCVRAREKVGIVGRTGAGKSSLISMLFRMVEPTGKLMIDGIDIQQIGLHDLRKTISIIPQNPVLFTGALRKNLDPFNKHEDSQLWNAFGEVQMKGVVEDLPGQLESEVFEGGINFSVGQRQLICLARAILRKNRILLIDEATANVDPKTDELIQATIRDKFRQCTVLTVAHRLHTIMDSDRVLVLDEGKIMDFDEPHLLLEKGQGLFYQLVQQTGKTEADYLADIALAAYEKRFSGQGDSQPNLDKAKDSDVTEVKDSQVTEVKDSQVTEVKDMGGVISNANLKPVQKEVEEEVEKEAVVAGDDDNDDDVDDVKGPLLPRKDSDVENSSASPEEDTKRKKLSSKDNAEESSMPLLKDNSEKTDSVNV